MITARQWIWVAALFALTLLVRLPVRWAAPLLPDGAHCLDPSGTLWSGHCARVGAGTFTINDVSWSAHPWLLLIGRVGGAVRSADPNAAVAGELRLGPGGRFELRGLKGSVAISSGLLPLFPNDWGGTLGVDIDVADFSAGVLQRIRGVLNASGLRQRTSGGELGSYELRFEDAGGAADTIVGALRDTAGPLSVTARLQVAHGGTYELNGTVQARPSANASLASSVESLGPADASGRRQFSLAGGL